MKVYICLLRILVLARQIEPDYLHALRKETQGLREVFNFPKKLRDLPTNSFERQLEAQVGHDIFHTCCSLYDYLGKLIDA